VIALLVAALSATAPGYGQGRPSATPVRAAEVVQRDLEERQRVTGEVRAAARVQVASREEGVVRETRIEAGDRVQAGAVLATIDDARVRLDAAQLDARLMVANAALSVRQAELGQMESDLAAIENLAARNAINLKELTDARSAVAIAAARLEEARADRTVVEAQRAVMQRRLEDMVIRSPFDGIVLQRKADVGGWIGVGDAVAEVVSDGLFDVLLDLPQSLAAKLSGASTGNRRVTLEVPAAGLHLSDQAAAVIPSVDPVSRTFRIRVRVEDPDRMLADGMSATGWVPAGQRGSWLVVPRDALLENPAGFFVYVVRSMGEGPPQAVPVQVRVRFSIEGGVAVESSDLHAGEQVVVEGNERLFPMMPVLVVRPDDAAGDA